MPARSSDELHSERALLMCETRSGEERLSGPQVEDLEDGTVRLQVDQVMPWSVAVQILDRKRCFQATALRDCVAG
jgi:hypothetical protein